MPCSFSDYSLPRSAEKWLSIAYLGNKILDSQALRPYHTKATSTENRPNQS